MFCTLQFSLNSSLNWLQTSSCSHCLHWASCTSPQLLSELSRTINIGQMFSFLIYQISFSLIQYGPGKSSMSRLRLTSKCPPAQLSSLSPLVCLIQVILPFSLGFPRPSYLFPSVCLVQVATLTSPWPLTIWSHLAYVIILLGNSLSPLLSLPLNWQMHHFLV